MIELQTRLTLAANSMHQQRSDDMLQVRSNTMPATTIGHNNKSQTPRSPNSNRRHSRRNSSAGECIVCCEAVLLLHCHLPIVTLSYKYNQRPFWFFLFLFF